jgi:predicted nuclease of predicted toxin-antitoxin system
LQQLKVLLDTGISHKHIAILASAGIDAVWAGTPEDLGDAAILLQAVTECRTLITLDKDFGELVICNGTSHKGIVRITDGYKSSEHPQIIIETLQLYWQELLSGAIITVMKGRPLRIRKPML